jgi:2-polyprenyl-3-methyl-5-hydroxy-6-metoxy-1,4-benzoquinol methylase
MINRTGEHSAWYCLQIFGFPSAFQHFRSIFRILCAKPHLDFIFAFPLSVTSQCYKDYGFADAAESHMHRRFMPHVEALTDVLAPGTRVLDVGCGNGAACGEFIRRGCQVVGIDLSEQRITWARRSHPAGRFEVLAADEQVLDRLQESAFDLVISTEVVEHLYAPREWAAGCFHALKPGG